MQPFAVRRVCIAIDPEGGRPANPDHPVVLLITEDGDLRAAAVRALGNQGYDVEAVPHAGHAVLVCLKRARIDVVVVELSMADTSGPALAERLRRHHPELRSIYLAQPGTPECESLLVRPFTRDDLVRSLEAALTSPAL